MASEEQLPELELSLGLPVGGSRGRTPRPAAGTTVGHLCSNFAMEDGVAGRGDLQHPTEAGSRTRGMDSRDKELLEAHRWNFGSKPGGIGNPTLAPVQYRPYPQELYVPAVDVLGLPCMIPCWAPAVSPAGEGSNPPVGCRCSWTAGKDLAVIPVRADSTGSNSSGISVRRSGSMQERSMSNNSSCNDTRGKSLRILEKPQHEKAASVQVQVTNKKLASLMATEERKRSSFSQMPYVMTTGDGPNGKKITGVLYKYISSEQVSILCICHGLSFSPAEFVRHSGGTETAHPLRQIVMVPSRP